MITKINYFKILVAATALMTGAVVTAQKSILINFEDPAKASEWLLEGNTATLNNVDLATARSGAKTAQISGFNRNTGFHFKNTVRHIVVQPGEYIHTRVFFGSSQDGAQAAPTYSSSISSPTPGSWKNAVAGEVSVAVIDNTERANSDSNPLQVYPRLRMKPGADFASNVLYFDDCVLYTDANPKIDNDAPLAASGLSANGNTLSWTEGTDDKSGIDSTLILRSKNTSATAPVLTPYTAYSAAGLPVGIASVGDWTVIGTVAMGTVSYTDTGSDAGTSYKYAVVHKDLAYNYSDAVTVDVTGTLTNITDALEETFNCFGTEGGIELNNLPLGEELSIHNSAGVQVYAKTLGSSQLFVDLPKGMYIVRVDEATSKVIVK